jgi:ABC-2 type transport system permease protein
MGSLYPHPLPVDEVLDLTGMTPLARRRTQKLSGGETQRLRFALALVANPDLLVLDEPTVAMDVEARRSFWATMRRFTARGTTVVFATHYLEEADEFADRVVLMAHGRIVADGPSTEIKAGHRDHRRRPGGGVPGDHGAGRPGGRGGGAGGMSTAVYARSEVLRTFRNRRFLIFSLIFPLTMYLLIAGPNRGEDDLGGSGISAPLYYMVGLIGFGTMMAVTAGGARIAAERTVGWNRQLRLTPLTARSYLTAKVMTGYLMAGVSILIVSLAGVSLGVRMPAMRWLEMIALILVALIPFAGVGIAIGHLFTTDSLGPALGGITSIFAFLGGTWFPITGSGFFVDLAHALPSYWLVEAGHIGIGGSAWGGEGWLIVSAWSVAMALAAAWAYRRDTKRV